MSLVHTIDDNGKVFLGTLFSLFLMFIVFFRSPLKIKTFDATGL